MTETSVKMRLCDSLKVHPDTFVGPNLMQAFLWKLFSSQLILDTTSHSVDLNHPNVQFLPS